MKLNINKINRLVCVFGGSIGLMVSVSGYASPIDDIRRLVESGQFEVAYKAALAYPEQIGTPHFDFLYGMAALGAGHVAEGVLALERHLVAVPANDRARLEMARGYFQLGELGRARLEFELVLKHNPPVEVQANIRHYLDSMQTRDSASLRATSRFYVDAGYGRDSNVNSGTYNTNVNLLSGTIPIANSSSTQAADNYGQLALGGQWMKRVSPQLAVFAGGDLDVRQNEKKRAFSLTSYGGFLGFSYLKGSGLYRVTAADSEIAVGNVRYRNMYSVTGEAQYTLAPGRSLAGFAQYGEAAFAGANQVQDSKLATLGATLSQSFEGMPLHPNAGVRLSLTDETNLRMRPDLSRKISTFQVFGSVAPMERMAVTMGYTQQLQNYQKADLAFGTVRNDTLRSLDLGVNYAVDRNWSARCEIQVADNASNQSLYAFKKRAVALKARYEY